jgi:hypothetical protein
LQPYIPCSPPERWICFVSNQLFGAISGLQSPVEVAISILLTPDYLRDFFRSHLESSHGQVSCCHCVVSCAPPDLFCAELLLSFRTAEL